MDKSVERGREALTQYKKTKVMPVFPEEMDSTDFAVWRSIFRDYPDIWPEITIIENQRQAKKSFLVYKQNPCPVLLNQIADLCLAMLEHYSVFSDTPKKVRKIYRELQPKILKVWLKTFSEYLSEFVSNFKEGNQFHGKYFPEDSENIDKILEVTLIGGGF